MAKARPTAIAHRSRATLLLLPEFASEVLGFLGRVHIGSSLLANSNLHDLICQLKQRLPLHQLRCTFENEFFGDGCVRWYSGAYWLVIRHIRRDLSYTDARHFKLPSTAGPQKDCALIRYYLSNSYVDDLRFAEADGFPFAIKMLANLASRNFSVGIVELCAEAQRLSDYRSMDTIFGGMRMGALHMSCDEHRFVELVKTTNFFRMSTVQGLRELKLDLSPQWTHEEEPRGRGRSRSPLWVLGIRLLLNCEYYRVDYGTDRHLRSIERKMVQICEEFERGGITDTVEHFHFRPHSLKPVNYAFSRDNLLVSGMKVEGPNEQDPLTDIEWDVYRFRNTSTGGYLTACVSRTSTDPIETTLHIVRGEVYPNASFADYSDA